MDFAGASVVLLAARTGVEDEARNILRAAFAEARRLLAPIRLLTLGTRNLEAGRSGQYLYSLTPSSATTRYTAGRFAMRSFSAV